MTHNSTEVLPALLESIERYEPECAVVVVDSGSDVGPTPEERWPVISLAENVGYGRACNIGAARFADEPPRYVAFLNPDIELLGSALSDLASGMNELPTAGIATGTIVNPMGMRVPAAWGPPTLTRLVWNTLGMELHFLRRLVGRFLTTGAFTSGASMTSSHLEVDGFVLGGFMMIRWECLEEIGGFDDRYFLNWEDTDICIRARQHGWKVWQLPTSPVVHRGGASSSSTSRAQWRHWYRESAYLFSTTHWNGLRRAAATWILRIDRTFESWRSSD